MSGGHFNYYQDRIPEIAESIKREIRRSEDGFECYPAREDHTPPFRSGDSDWVFASSTDDKKYRIPQKNIIDRYPKFYGEDNNGVPIFDKPENYNNYPPEILEIFKEGVRKLKEAAVYAQRIDWYLSGDDGEETLIERLKEDLDEVKQEITELENNNWNIGVAEQYDDEG
jgi:hypothetical protein